LIKSWFSLVFPHISMMMDSSTMCMIVVFFFVFSEWTDRLCPIESSLFVSATVYCWYFTFQFWRTRFLLCFWAGVFAVQAFLFKKIVKYWARWNGSLVLIKISSHKFWNDNPKRFSHFFKKNPLFLLKLIILLRIQA
jgi:hypothetical protein